MKSIQPGVMPMKFSQNAVKILGLFYSHPKEQFYIHQLGRLLKKKPGVFQRVLYNLEKQGVLKSRFLANARYFSLNEKYPFYKELKSIIQKMTPVISLVFLLNTLLISPNTAFCDNEILQTLELSSFSEAAKIALKNNKDIQIQEQALNIASADILNAKSEFLPKVDFNSSYTHNGAVLHSGNSTAAKKDPGIFSGFKNDNALGISVSETVYNGGANTALLRQAQLALKEQTQTLRATRLNVELEAKRLYYGLLLAYETRRIAANLIQQAQSHYEQIKQNLSQGTSSRFDLLQSKVQVSLLMPQLINADNSIDLIVAEFNKLLGRNVMAKIIVVDKLNYEPFEIKESDFLKEAYLNEPEMILRSLGIDISKWAVKYARAGWLPQVEAGADYSYRSNNLGNMVNSKHNNWNIGFTVRVPIFDGFSTKAKVDAARAKYMQSVIGKDNYADQVAVDVRQACLDLKQASAIIESQRDNLEDASEALEISYVRYNNGVGINLDVMDAQVSLANVEKNFAEGVYDYIMAKAKLDRLMGKGGIEEAK